MPPIMLVAVADCQIQRQAVRSRLHASFQNLAVTQGRRRQSRGSAGCRSRGDCSHHKRQPFIWDAGYPATRATDPTARADHAQTPPYLVLLRAWFTYHTRSPEPMVTSKAFSLERDAGLCYRGGVQEKSFRKMQAARCWLRNREFPLGWQHNCSA